MSTKDYVIADGGEITPSDNKLNFNNNKNAKKTNRSDNEKKRNILGLKSKFGSVIIIIIISWAIYVFISLIAYHDQSTTKLPGWISSFLTFLPSVFSGNSETIIHPSLQHLANAESDVNTTMLGALLPISGASASLGESEQVALKIAINDINKYFSENHSKTRYGLVIQDTGSDPQIGLEKVKRLSDRGIKIIIGPSTSANVNQIRDYATSTWYIAC